MAEQKPIKELQPGERVANTVYLLEEKSIRTTKNGSPYLSVRLRDGSGHIEGRLWNLTPGVAEALVEGQGVLISGEVTSYRDQLQIKIQAIQPQLVDTRDFIPSSPRDRKEMEAELTHCIHGVSDPWLRPLLEQIFVQDTTFRTLFLEAPAAKQYHHACLGGLIEHTLAVAALAQIVAPLYPQLPPDLLLTLALLHDVGKVDAYNWRTALDRSDDGELLEHLYLGARRVERALDRIPGFPDDLRRRVLHALLAHHGQEALGSPVRPKTLEAIVLHHLDLLDSRIRGFLDHLEHQGDPKAAWSDWSKMFEARLYRGPGGISSAGSAEEEEPWDDFNEGDLPF